MSLAERRMWVDGVLVPWDRVTVHILAVSPQRGYLAFDVLSCHWLPSGPAVIGLRAHAERFLRSAELAGMRVALKSGEVCAAIAQTVRANPGAELVKICAYYPGISADLLPVDPAASVAVAAFARADLGEEAASEKPLRLLVSDAQKQPAEVITPQAKLAGSYTYAAVAQFRARALGFDDVLLIDRDGCVAETPTRSFLWVSDGRLVTPPLDLVLEGVTRALVLDLARDEGLEIRERREPVDRLAQASEAFVTSTTVGIRAVACVGDIRFPGPVPGPVTLRLRGRLEAMLRGEKDDLAARWLEPLE